MELLLRKVKSSKLPLVHLLNRFKEVGIGEVELNVCKKNV